MIKELGNFRSYKEVLDFVPRSVWEINSRTKNIKELFEDDLEKHTCKRTKDGYAVSINQKYSVFNPLLAINILKIWSKVGDSVIDPFGGRDRAIITNYMERHYLGLEISPQTYVKISTKIQTWKYLNKDYRCQVFLADGTKPYLSLNLKSFDFCYTCPPYWFKEKYESVPGQISDIKTEEGWKEAISKTAYWLKDILKKDAYAVFILGDIRDKGKLIPLHCHWIEKFIMIGFKLKDIIINRTNPITCAGINGYLRNRIMQKTHEYILVFQNE